MQTPDRHIAFSDAVRAIQSARGSREAYARMETRGMSANMVDETLREMLAEVDTAFLATASADGRPYVQHRGGPRGFIRALDESTLAFADFTGNRQYITAGNLSENDRALLFLIDFVHGRRIKVWGRARIVDDDPALLADLMPKDYSARPEQALVLHVDAWDGNCRQHIQRKIPLDDVAALVDRFEARIAALETQNEALRRQLSRPEGDPMP